MTNLSYEEDACILSQSPEDPAEADPGLVRFALVLDEVAPVAVEGRQELGGDVVVVAVNHQDILGPDQFDYVDPG